MKKSFYIGSIAGVGILGIVLCKVGMIKHQAGGNGVWLLLVLLGAVMLAYAFVVALVMWYKAWEAILDGHARTTPGKAIGFLLIPIFNYYWLFQAFWGFAKDYNSYISRHGISIPELSSGLFLAFSIFYLVLMLYGFVGRLMVGALIQLVILAVIANKICDAVNALSEKAALDEKVYD